MQEIFDDYVMNAFGAAEQVPEKIRLFEHNYRRHFPIDPGARVVDIGVGRGEMLSCMRAWGYVNYRGVDISPATVEFCRGLGLQCERVDDTVAWLDEHGGALDAVTLLDVLEHVPKDHTIGFLRAIHGALREGGLLIVQVPNLQAPDAQLHRYNDITHEVGYVEHSLRQVLLAGGFRDITFTGFEQFVPRGPLEVATWKTWISRALRAVYHRWVRFARGINGNLNPAILDPVLCAIVRR